MDPVDAAARMDALLGQYREELRGGLCVMCGHPEIWHRMGDDLVSECERPMGSSRSCSCTGFVPHVTAGGLPVIEAPRVHDREPEPRVRPLVLIGLGFLSGATAALGAVSLGVSVATVCVALALLAVAVLRYG